MTADNSTVSLQLWRSLLHPCMQSSHTIYILIALIIVAVLNIALCVYNCRSQAYPCVRHAARRSEDAESLYMEVL
ncbi:hypothetical protein QR680_000038 [Steinernema hermaphroditum]|uniref:Uncharacterized protein n=1 Tax=Steinernema hermaphroditum TaxID=289476 RepID=A0AA39LDE0_9BILA|nr:hypothetical protein QR680_000038 [Steinernema hermaphroditum]